MHSVEMAMCAPFLKLRFPIRLLNTYSRDNAFVIRFESTPVTRASPFVVIVENLAKERRELISARVEILLGPSS